jgi:hypothetical protein
MGIFEGKGLILATNDCMYDITSSNIKMLGPRSYIIWLSFLKVVPFEITPPLTSSEEGNKRRMHHYNRSNERSPY